MCVSATTATTPSTGTWCGRSAARCVPAIVLPPLTLAAGVHQDLQDRDEGAELQPQLQGVQAAPRQAVRRACESAAS